MAENNNPSDQNTATNLVGKFENTNIRSYSTLWSCYICMAIILKETAIEPHLKKCMASEKKNRGARQKNSEKIGLPLDEKKVYGCEKCYKAFNSKADFDMHLKKHCMET